MKKSAKEIKLSEAKDILKQLGVPEKRINDLYAGTFLALADIKPEDDWANAKKKNCRILNIMLFFWSEYGIEYDFQTKDFLRNTCLEYLEEVNFVEDSARQNSNGRFQYKLKNEFLNLIRKYGSSAWKKEVKKYLLERDALLEKNKKELLARLTTVVINGEEYRFSKGENANVRKAVLEYFVPIFARDSVCVYLSDKKGTALYKDDELLQQLGFNLAETDKLPDIILYKKDSNWLYLIEDAVHSEPISFWRMNDLKNMTSAIEAGKIYVTACEDINTYKKFAKDFAWDTEVWLADMPGHMIHFNGDRFMGPR